MYIKSLEISGRDGIIRTIDFHQGLNLFVDETPTKEIKKTGNGVGKTTALILIDFCLGAKKSHVYTDIVESKKTNQTVKDFLNDYDVSVTLTLTEDLEDPKAEQLVLTRSLKDGKRKGQRFNGAEVTLDEYSELLTNYFFPEHYGNKPTYRQIFSHNIRYQEPGISNTTHTLDKYTSDVEYETLYLFLLGLDYSQGQTKQNILSEIKVEEAFIDRLVEDKTKSTYETMLAIIDQEINKLNQKKELLNINPNFDSDLQSLTEIQKTINSLVSKLTQKKIREDIILQAQKELANNKTQIDTDELQLIYQQATDMVDGIHKSFQELCDFHNLMIDEKIRFITKDLPALQQEISVLNQEISRLKQEEKAIALLVTQKDSFKDLEQIISSLNDLHRQKGEYENIITQISKSERTLEKHKKDLAEIDSYLFSDSFRKQLRERVDKFNTFFTAVSDELYGEKFALSFDPHENKGKTYYKFSSFNMNFSTGRKQGEIICFDIAYTLFADHENIPTLHFLLNDKKELMHGNQLVHVSKLVAEKNIQLILPILRDKLPPQLDNEDYFVVKLSQSDKLFRIEKISGK